MPNLVRKYTTKSGEVKVYTYIKNIDTPAKIKRRHLTNFIEAHREELNEIPNKKDKIQWIMNNIDDTYDYSFSMIYRYLPTVDEQDV